MNSTFIPSTRAPAAPSGVTESVRKPLYNVKCNTDAYEVWVEMPGVPKSGAKLDLEASILTVRGERASNVREGLRTLHRELSPLNYLLRLRLNKPVDEDKMTAKLEGGVLIITLPFQEVARPRQILVN
ncbi:MAG: Hsp20/alpha crystallin family protein [Prosthecobacter sp.]